MLKEDEIDFERIGLEVEEKMRSLLDSHPRKPGTIFVVGCSSSEIVGGRIGKDSSAEAGKVVFETARKICGEKGLFLACQCCEHLNRALVVESACAEKFNLDEVSVVPWAHGGGSLATAAYSGFENPVCRNRHRPHDDWNAFERGRGPCPLRWKSRRGHCRRRVLTTEADWRRAREVQSFLKFGTMQS